MRCLSSIGETPRKRFTSIGSSVSKPTRSSNDVMGGFRALEMPAYGAGAAGTSRTWSDVGRVRSSEQQSAAGVAPGLGAGAGGTRRALRHQQFTEISPVQRNENQRLAGAVEAACRGDRQGAGAAYELLGGGRGARALVTFGRAHGLVGVAGGLDIVEAIADPVCCIL